MSLPPTNDPRARAQVLIELKRYRDAIPLLQEALTQDPANAELLSQLAMCQYNTGYARDSLRTLKTALAAQPDHYLPHLLMGEILRLLGQHEKAYDFLERAGELAPELAVVHLEKARVRLAQERYRGALTATGAGLRLEPAHVDLLNVRAQALYLLNRKTEARAVSDLALNKQPEAADTHLLRGWLLLEQRDRAAAEVHFREALRLQPALSAARTGLKEALKARWPLYRPLKSVHLLFRRYRGSRMWMVIVMFLFLLRPLLERGLEQGLLEPYVLAGVVFPTLAVSSFGSVSDLFFWLLYTRERHLLNDEERTKLLVVAILAVLFTGLAVYWLS